jgi:hypothetical protein
MTFLATFAVLTWIASIAFILGVVSVEYPKKYRGQRFAAILIVVAVCYAVAEFVGR